MEGLRTGESEGNPARKSVEQTWATALGKMCTEKIRTVLCRMTATESGLGWEGGTAFKLRLSDKRSCLD